MTTEPTYTTEQVLVAVDHVFDVTTSQQDGVRRQLVIAAQDYPAQGVQAPTTYFVVSGRGSASEVEAYLYSGQVEHSFSVNADTVAFVSGANAERAEYQHGRFGSGLWQSFDSLSLQAALSEYTRRITDLVRRQEQAKAAAVSHLAPAASIAASLGDDVSEWEV